MPTLPMADTDRMVDAAVALVDGRKIDELHLHALEFAPAIDFVRRHRVVLGSGRLVWAWITGHVGIGRHQRLQPDTLTG